MAKRTKHDVANDAVQVFLQAVGAQYDRERGLEPWQKRRHLSVVLDFFNQACCYCGARLSVRSAHEDHLIPRNKTCLGLHAWGNVVPACERCNSDKHSESWTDFLASRDPKTFTRRKTRIREFQKHYDYAPSVEGLRLVTEALSREIGAISDALVAEKLLQVADVLQRLGGQRRLPVAR